MVAPTGLSRLSLGIDPATGSHPPGDTGPFLSVGTQNFAGIARISSGTIAVGELALAAHASSVTTFAAPGLEADDFLHICAVSDGSANVVIAKSWVSEADVGAVEFVNASASALTQAADTQYRWTGIAYG